MEKKIDDEFQRQLCFYDPGDKRLCEEDTRKLIGMLAEEMGAYPIDIVPAITRMLASLPEKDPEWYQPYPNIARGETDLGRVALEIAVQEIAALLGFYSGVWDKKAER